MEDMILLFMAWTGLIIFKYSAFILAEESDINPFLTLIPGLDVVAVLSYFDIPLWTLLIIFIPVVNGIVPLICLIAPPVLFLETQQVLDGFTIGFCIVGILFLLYVGLIFLALGAMIALGGIIGIAVVTVIVHEIHF